MNLLNPHLIETWARQICNRYCTEFGVSPGNLINCESDKEGNKTNHHLYSTWLQPSQLPSPAGSDLDLGPVEVHLSIALHARRTSLGKTSRHSHRIQVSKGGPFVRFWFMHTQSPWKAHKSLWPFTRHGTDWPLAADDCATAYCYETVVYWPHTLIAIPQGRLNSSSPLKSKSWFVKVITGLTSPLNS